MTQLKPFRKTMTEIGNAFGFQDIQRDELEKYYELEFNSRPYDKERANAILFLRYYSDETAIMLEFVKLYVQIQQAQVHTINTNIGFLMESNPVPRVYTTLEALVEYLAKYRIVVADTEVFLTRFHSIQPIELI